MRSHNRLIKIALNLLPPANEVCEGYVFTPVCQSFCSRGGTWVGTPPGLGKPPSDQVNPPDQVPPETRCIPQTRYIPPGTMCNPLTRYTPKQCMLGDTGNKQALRILLECILVLLTSLLFSGDLYMCP